jgi:putative DNA methylase
LIATDPPYAGNVNYAELADFFYVWLRLALARRYPQFVPELTPKAEEIIENRSRGKTMGDFETGLKEVFLECNKRSKDGALFVFTFHHSEGSAWEALLEAICEAGWVIESVYPIQAEAETSMNLQAGTNISYDLIHVCRKRRSDAVRERVAWATIRTQIRREARIEVKRIAEGRYGEQGQLSPADRLIVLTGKCLQLYSRHYGSVVDHNFNVVPLRAALADIRMFVDQLVSQERPLPGELEDIDRPSYIWLTTLSEKREIKSDEVSKATRGIIEVDELLAAGLIKRGRVGRGRTYEVKTPIERYSDLQGKFRESAVSGQPSMFAESSPSEDRSLFIDRLHFLIAVAEGKQDLRPWFERWSADIPRLRVAAEYLLVHSSEYGGSLTKIVGMLAVGPLGFE